MIWHCKRNNLRPGRRVYFLDGYALDRPKIRQGIIRDKTGGRLNVIGHGILYGIGEIFSSRKAAKARYKTVMRGYIRYLVDKISWHSMRANNMSNELKVAKKLLKQELGRLT